MGSIVFGSLSSNKIYGNDNSGNINIGILEEWSKLCWIICYNCIIIGNANIILTSPNHSQPAAAAQQQSVDLNSLSSLFNFETGNIFIVLIMCVQYKEKH